MAENEVYFNLLKWAARALYSLKTRQKIRNFMVLFFNFAKKISLLFDVIQIGTEMDLLCYTAQHSSIVFCGNKIKEKN